MSSKVINTRGLKPDAKYIVVCFPWAGGGSNFYANWTKLVPDFMEVCGITLPGREARFREPCHSRLQDHIQETSDAIMAKCQQYRRMAFWGHSMGALLAFQVALKLRRDHNLEPTRLVVSGISAPHSAKRKERKVGVDQMNDEEFKDYLRGLGGTPKEVLENKDMMELFLPPLRADYSMLDQLSYDLPESAAPPLTCPIDVFDGEDDIDHDLDAWRDLTTAETKEWLIRKLPGGHFYLKEPHNQEAILQHIVQSLS